MSILKSIAARTAAALRLLATGESKRTRPEIPELKHAPAAPADKARPYNIMVLGADGELVSKPATAEEALAYTNGGRAWRRIG